MKTCPKCGFNYESFEEKINGMLKALGYSRISIEHMNACYVTGKVRSIKGTAQFHMVLDEHGNLIYFRRDGYD